MAVCSLKEIQFLHQPQRVSAPYRLIEKKQIESQLHSKDVVSSFRMFVCLLLFSSLSSLRHKLIRNELVSVYVCVCVGGGEKLLITVKLARGRNAMLYDGITSVNYIADFQEYIRSIRFD